MSGVTKNVIVFGATGGIGKHLLCELVNAKYNPTAVVRTAEQEQSISSIAGGKPISTVKLTLDSASVKDIANVIKGHGAVVFTAGSGGKKLLEVDLDGAVKTFEAARLANVRRLIIISALHAENRESFAGKSLNSYYISKHYADRILMNEFKADLDFTILKPTALANGSGSGKIQIVGPSDGSNTTIDRIDVARVIVLVLNNPSTYGKSYDFAQGDLNIDDSSVYE